jgi:hypothetical protein
MNRDSRITRAQLAQVLTRASELQARREGDLDDSLSVAEVESVAAEVGIGPEFVQVAARALGERLAAPQRSVLGPPAEWVAEHAFAGRLTADEAVRLIAEAQVAVPIAGGTVDRPAEGVWRLSHEDRALVQVVARGNEFTVAIVRDRRLLRLGLLGGGGAGGAFVGAQLGAAALFAAAPAMPALFAMGVPIAGLAGGVAGVLGGAACWRATARRWSTRAEGAFTRIGSALRGAEGAPPAATPAVEPPSLTPPPRAS